MENLLLLAARKRREKLNAPEKLMQSFVDRQQHGSDLNTVLDCAVIWVEIYYLMTTY